MKSPDSVELRQLLVEILRAGVAANQDRELASVPAGGAPEVQRKALHSTEPPEPGPEGSP